MQRHAPDAAKPRPQSVVRFMVAAMHHGAQRDAMGSTGEIVTDLMEYLRTTTPGPLQEILGQAQEELERGDYLSYKAVRAAVYDRVIAKLGKRGAVIPEVKSTVVGGTWGNDQRLTAFAGQFNDGRRSYDRFLPGLKDDQGKTGMRVDFGAGEGGYLKSTIAEHEALHPNEPLPPHSRIAVALEFPGEDKRPYGPSEPTEGRRRAALALAEESETFGTRGFTRLSMNIAQPTHRISRAVVGTDVYGGLTYDPNFTGVLAEELDALQVGGKLHALINIGGEDTRQASVFAPDGTRVQWHEYFKHCVEGTKLISFQYKASGAESGIYVEIERTKEPIRVRALALVDTSFGGSFNLVAPRMLMLTDQFAEPMDKSKLPLVSQLE